MKKKIIIITLLVIASLFILGITYSMYNNEASLNTNIALATFVVDAKKKDHIDMPLSDIKPGESITYNFSVSNSSNTKTSDVSIIYNIIIKTMHFIPLNIELYKGDELILTCSEDIERNELNELECQTEDVVMPYISTVKDDYSLKLEFPIEYSSNEYASLVDYMNIEIKSMQKID